MMIIIRIDCLFELCDDVEGWGYAGERMSLGELDWTEAGLDHDQSYVT